VASRRGTVDEFSSGQGPGPVARSRTGTLEEDPEVDSDERPNRGRGRGRLDSDERQSGNEEVAMTGVQSLSSLKAGKPLLNRRTSDSEAFDRTVEVARAMNLPIEEVHAKWDDFVRFDKSCNGTLSLEEFRLAVREKCDLPSDAEVPEHLLKHCWGSADDDGDGQVTFEEFVVWSMKTAYTEEILVTDLKERQLRLMARTHGLCLTDVERIKDVFDRFDGDASGHIDEDEFRKILLVFMKVKNPADVSEKKLKRYWREVDADRSGSIDFEEFLLWYYRCFAGDSF
jgi:Ca2+-binding EF-hand superfamily protein